MTWCEHNGIDLHLNPASRSPKKVSGSCRRRSHATRHREFWLFCAAIPRRVTRPSPGVCANGEPSPVLRRRRSAIDVPTSSRHQLLDVLHGNRPGGSYDSLYCARGQAGESDQAALQTQFLASGRTSCRSALANQVRLVLHTAAYWLMLTVRDAIPKVRELATAEFATLRLRLLKIAARVVETASRIRLAFAAACPSRRDPLRGLPGAPLTARSPDRWGVRSQISPAHPSSASQSTGRQAVKKPKAILCVSSEQIPGRINRTKKLHSHE